MDFVRDHPYLFANLPLWVTVLSLLMAFRCRCNARLALLSGLACMPCALLAPLHDGAYWKPVRVAGGMIGFEDFIFSFTVGAIAWLAAAWPLSGRYRMQAAFAHWSMACIALLGFLAGILTFGLWRFGMDPMTSTMLSAALLLLALLIRRPRLTLPALTGAAFFLPFYIALVKVQFWAWPRYVTQWVPGEPWAARIIGIPCGEFIWAAVFAGLWPVVTASAFEVRFEPIA